MRGDARQNIGEETVLAVLKEEIRRATGCTEVGAAALVAARAAEALGCVPEKLRITVSPNVYKNAAHVGVPGTPLRGIAPAAALGAVIGKAEAGLAVLDAVNADTIAQASTLLREGRVRATFELGDDGLYLRAEAEAGEDAALAEISGAHDRFTLVTKNGETLLRDDAPAEEADPATLLRDVPVAHLLDVVARIPAADLAFLIDAADLNAAAAQTDLDSGAPLGRALAQRAQAAPSPRAAAQALAGAASEARMSGAPVPVMAITGSGNHGITNFLGVLGFAQSIGASREELARALAISSIITVAIKAHTGKLTAFCGCAVAPATGLAAAAAYLLGGDLAAQEHAMQSMIGTFAGLLCDGAKASCAYKVATVVGAAIDLATLAVEGVHVPDGDGILGAGVDASFANLGRLNDPGMRGTEEVVLGMIEH